MATDGGLNAITVKMYICILEVSLNRPLDYVCLSSSYCKLVPCQRVTSEAMSVVTINNGLLIFDIRRYRASPNPLYSRRQSMIQMYAVFMKTVVILSL